MIDIKQAHQLIDDLKTKAIKDGREESTWCFYSGHIENTAKAAQLIAEKIGLDPKRAYIFGLLHDLGKIEESKTGRFHGVIGYEMLKDQDEQAAKICLLHMFAQDKIPPIEITKSFCLSIQEDHDFIVQYAIDNPLDDYDLLIKLADSLANYQGLVTLEDRAIEYIERHNLNKNDEEIKKSISKRLYIKEYFDKKLGQDIYEFLGLK